MPDARLIETPADRIRGLEAQIVALQAGNTEGPQSFADWADFRVQDPPMHFYRHSDTGKGCWYSTYRVL